MSRGGQAQRPNEAGFTLVELLAVVTILGLISFALTEAFIVGLKTTDANADNISRSVAVQALQSYFTGDAQSAKLVSTVDPAPTCSTSPGVFLHLSWTDPQGSARDVSYSLDADPTPVAGQRELVRWSCTANGAPDKRMLGRLAFAPSGPQPVQALCDGSSCPVAPGAPDVVALRILTPVSLDLSVQRRAA